MKDSSETLCNILIEPFRTVVPILLKIVERLTITMLSADHCEQFFYAAISTNFVVPEPEGSLPSL
jgi:hypothetical protein